MSEVKAWDVEAYESDDYLFPGCLFYVGPAEGVEKLADANLIAQAPAMLADLKLAAETLRRYEAAHRAKNTEESTAKAEVNASLASRFEETIRKTGC